MPSFLNRLQLVFLCFVFFSVAVQAQVSEGGRPASVDPRFAAVLAAVPVPAVALPPIDATEALAEDSRTPEPTRFAAPIAADIAPSTAGVWTDLPDGSGRVWRCAVTSAGAHGLLLLFDRFDLPAGARFFAGTPDGTRRFGAYTARSLTEARNFLIGVVPGDTTVLEYFEPAYAKDQGEIHIDRVDYVYDRGAWQTGEVAGAPGFGTSQSCNVNVNCPAGANYQNEKKGVARILMVFNNGSAYCSGSLIGNTAGSAEPYFLTAHHCQIILPNGTPNFSLWRFDFNYEAPGCTNPATEPQALSVLGCTRSSYRAETDFLLLKLSTLPINSGFYFNGWSRTPPTTAPGTAFVHHPFGDIKKFSASNQPATIHSQTINWGGVFGVSPANTHWNLVPTTGIYESGSSGSPLFDANKRIIGQLHGGIATGCNVTAAYFGRFDLSWSTGQFPAARLSDWLDPNNTGALTQNGYTQPVTSFYTVSGQILTAAGLPMPGVLVQLNGSTADPDTTDAQGNFSFTNVIQGGPYVVTPAYTVNALNGVSTLDMLKISRHVLGVEVLDSPWKMIAADVNKSASVTSYDNVLIRKLVLGIDNTFADVPSWRFFPASTTFPSPSQPFGAALPPGTITIPSLTADFTTANFIGVKMGDVNDSATPGQ